MTEAEIRFKCLEMAVTERDSATFNHVFEVAEAYIKFVEGCSASDLRRDEIVYTEVPIENGNPNYHYKIR